MTLLNTHHPSSRSAPHVSNLALNSSCLHALLARKHEGGAITFTSALHNVSAEKHMSSPFGCIRVNVQYLYSRVNVHRFALWSCLVMKIGFGLHRAENH